MRFLLSVLFVISTQAFAAEEDLMAEFERIKCQTNPKTKEQTCTLDGKMLPSQEDLKKQSAKSLNDDELDTEIE